MTAFIIDPAVQNYAGHHLTAAAGWVEAAKASELDARILAHKECIPEAAGTALIEKVFSGSFYNVAPADQKEAWNRLRILQREFRDGLTRPLMQVGADDVVILAHSTLVTLNGVAAWAAGMPRERLPRLVVWLMMRPQDEDFVVPFGSTDCVVSAMDRLRMLFGGRLTLAGFTSDVCSRWEALNCGRVNLLPFTALRPALPARKDHIPSSPPLIVTVGHLGARKGQNLIPALIRELDRRGVQAHWMIGGSSYESDSPAWAEIEYLAKSLPNVSLATHPEGIGEYDGLLKSADLAVLPYSPEAYRERGSGVAEEAELLGLPYVAPEVAFSAAAVSAGTAVAFDEWTVEGVASALVEATSALPQLMRAAERRALGSNEQLREVRETFLLPLLRNSEPQTSVPPAPIEPLPGVDIIVTLHNYRRFLAECLRSVSQQSYPNWRCIVVDDGSTDLTFEELRAMVASFGDERITYERHGKGGGQLKAIATGLSLGSNPFVLMLDADDCLTDDALDVHLSWHLNSRVPVAFTSGRVQVIDEVGRPVAGCMDNLIWLDNVSFLSELPRCDGYRRPSAKFDTPPASFIKQDPSTLGRWFWSPTSGMMFRRSAMEIVLPDRIERKRCSVTGGRRRSRA